MAIDTSIYNRISPTQQYDPVGEFAKVQGVRNMIAQGQAQQQQLSLNAQRLENERLAAVKAKRIADDTEKFSQSYLQAGGDPDKTVALAAQQGIHPDVIQQFQKHVSDMAKTAAETKAQALPAEKLRIEQTQGLILSAKQMDDAALAANWPTIYARAVELDPKAKDHFDPLVPPTRQQLQAAEAATATQDYVFKTAEAQQKTAEDQRKAAEEARKAALAPALLKEAQNKAITSTPDPVTGLTKEQAQVAKQAADTLAEQKKTADYKNYELSKGEGFKGTFEQWQTQDANRRKQPVAQNPTSALPGLEKVPAHLAAPAAAAYSKSALAFADAKSAADEIQGVIDLVRSGNKAAGSNLPLLGVGALNAINGIKRMNKSEIDQYRGAGSLWDSITGKLGGLAEGKPIPADVLADIEALHKRLADGAVSKHTAEVEAINASHGSTFKPMQFSSDRSNPQAGSGPKKGDKQSHMGATYVFDGTQYVRQ